MPDPHELDDNDSQPSYHEPPPPRRHPNDEDGWYRTDDGDYARSRPRNWADVQAAARREWQRLRDIAVTVPCPTKPLGCGMPVGAACVNRAGAKPAVLKRAPAHPRRLLNALNAQQRSTQ